MTFRRDRGLDHGRQSIRDMHDAIRIVEEDVGWSMSDRTKSSDSDPSV